MQCSRRSDADFLRAVAVCSECLRGMDGRTSVRMKLKVLMGSARRAGARLIDQRPGGTAITDASDYLIRRVRVSILARDALFFDATLRVSSRPPKRPSY